jgi:hypothetical protein
MNPETRFTNKVRKLWKAAYPDIKIYKHSDRFTTGIADLHFIMPGAQTAWVEVKWQNYVANRRKGGVTALQIDFLEEHAEKGIPSFALIGTKAGCVWYRIEDYDGYVYARDLRADQYLPELVAEVLHG